MRFIKQFLSLASFLALVSFSNYSCTKDDSDPVVEDTIPVIDSAKVYKSGGTDGIRDLIVTADEGFLLAGFTTGYGAQGTDAYLVKVDSTGKLVWAKTFGGALNDEFGRVQKTADGGYIAVGTTKSYGYTYGNIFVTKLTASGNVSWSKRLTINNTTIGDFGADVLETREGNIVFSGSYQLSGGTADWVIGSFSSTGTLQWINRTGSSDSDPTVKIVEKGDSIVAIGSVKYGLSYDLAFVNIHKVTGIMSGSHMFDVANQFNLIMRPYATSQGFTVTSIATLGYNANENPKVFISKIDNTLSSFQSIQLETPGNELLSSCDAFSTQDNGVIVTQTTGISPKTIIVQKIGANNQILWSNKLNLPGTQLLQVIIEKKDGSIAAAGLHNNQFMLVRTNSEGKTTRGDVAMQISANVVTTNKLGFMPLVASVSKSDATIELNAVSRTPVLEIIK